MKLTDKKYFPLEVAAYLNDEKLKECSLSTQGIYIRLLLILHQQDTYGRVDLGTKNVFNSPGSRAEDAKKLTVQKQMHNFYLSQMTPKGVNLDNKNEENDFAYAKKMPFSGNFSEMSDFEAQILLFSEYFSPLLEICLSKIFVAIRELVSKNVIQLNFSNEPDEKDSKVKKVSELSQKRMIHQYAISIKRSTAGRKGGFANANRNLLKQISLSKSSKINVLPKQKEAEEPKNDTENGHIRPLKDVLPKQFAIAPHNRGVLGSIGEVSRELEKTESLKDLGRLPESVQRVGKLSYPELCELDPRFERDVSAEMFDEWKKFIAHVNDAPEDYHERLQIGGFAMPRDYVYIRKLGFTPDRWDEILQKMLSSNWTESMSMKWRIPEAIKWLEKSQNGNQKVGESIRNLPDNLSYSGGDF